MPPAEDQAGLAPGVPHFANLPLASLQRFGAAFFSGHLTNLPFASLHGAAREGAAVLKAKAAATINASDFMALSKANRVASETCTFGAARPMAHTRTTHTCDNIREGRLHG